MGEKKSRHESRGPRGYKEEGETRAVNPWKQTNLKGQALLFRQKRGEGTPVFHSWRRGDPNPPIVKNGGVQGESERRRKKAPKFAVLGITGYVEGGTEERKRGGRRVYPSLRKGNGLQRPKYYLY